MSAEPGAECVCSTGPRLCKDKSRSWICMLKVDLAKSIIALLCGTLSASKQSANLFSFLMRRKK